MPSRSKLWIFIPVMIFIPILLGMTPLNFIHKIGGGCPFSHDKQISGNFCPFHSIVSQDDSTAVNLISIPWVQNSSDLFIFQVSGLDSHRSEISLNFPPLRC